MWMMAWQARMSACTTVASGAPASEGCSTTLGPALETCRGGCRGGRAGGRQRAWWLRAGGACEGCRCALGQRLQGSSRKTTVPAPAPTVMVSLPSRVLRVWPSVRLAAVAATSGTMWYDRIWRRGEEEGRREG